MGTNVSNAAPGNEKGIKFSALPAAMRRMDLGAPILVIDDDPSFVEAMEGMLQAAGHTTAVAGNAFHGMKLAREAKPAVIVCDMMMPEMTGIDLLRALAADPATSKIPRVMMSGRSDADVSCAHAFLHKPFETAEMISVLRKASRAAANACDSLPQEAVWQG
jgi:CheY-like chemotaxis protein